MPAHYEVFDIKYHLFWSPEDWKPEGQCEKVSSLKNIFQKWGFYKKYKKITKIPLEIP